MGKIMLRLFRGRDASKDQTAEAAKWLSKDELDSVAWLPADITLIEKIRGCMG